jgi:hypothetical protein
MMPMQVNDVEIAFGGRTSELLPAYDTLPEEFQRERSPWCRLVDDWFFSGLTKERAALLITKPGVDRVEAFRHLRAVMGSFEPKHEHKVAGVAWLMSEWFESIPPKEKP